MDLRRPCPEAPAQFCGAVGEVLSRHGWRASNSGCPSSGPRSNLVGIDRVQRMREFEKRAVAISFPVHHPYGILVRPELRSRAGSALLW